MPGLGGLPFFLLALLALLLQLLALLGLEPAHHAHQEEEEGKGQEDAHEEVAQHGVHAGDKGAKGGEGHVADGHHIHLGVLLAVVDDGHFAQGISLGDGRGGGIAVQGQAEVQLFLVVLAGDEALHRFFGLEDHMGGLEGVAHGDLLQVGIRVQQGGGGEVGEAPVQQTAAL